MSENYELLQQAEFALDSARTVAESGNTAAGQTAPAGLHLPSEPAAQEEALKLVQRLFLNPGEIGPKAVLFAAIDRDNGCSRLSATAARLLAKSISESVCLVEGNFRSPSLGEVFGVSADRGLAEALRQNGPIRTYAAQIGPDNLWLIPAQTQRSGEDALLNCERLKDRISELRREFAYLVLTAPPLSSFADASLLGRLVDGVVLVLEANTTRREAAVKVTENLRAANVSVLGAVLNNRTYPIPAVLYDRL